MQRIIATCFIVLIKFWRPILGSRGCCRYVVSCTDYAIILLQDVQQFGTGIIHALNLIVKRVLSCHPFTRNKPN